MNATVTLKTIAKAAGGSPARYLVLAGKAEMGTIEKYANTRYETHPYKAFAGIGEKCRFLGSYYPSEGGKAAAVAAVLAA